MNLNKKIVDILYEIADIHDLQGIEFKPMAYRRAARAIESMRDDIEDYYEEDRLTDIKGIGESMEEKIKEIIETGTLEYLEDLREKVPIGLIEVMRIPNIGPKRAKKLHEELGIEDIHSLKEAAATGKVQKVEGFGKKTEGSIIKGIEMLEDVSGRHLLNEMMPVAEDMKDYLSPHTDDIEIAGSLRRMKETIGDADILVTGSSSGIMDRVVDYPGVDEVIGKGETKTSIRLKSGIRVDVRLVKRESFGAALQYFTGSKDHNIKLRQMAIDDGYKLNEYGLFRKEDDERVAGEKEKDVYGTLGLNWIPPELREDRGEIEAAGNDSLPDLVTMEDIKGDLQMHSDWSDGHLPIKEMAKGGADMGYDYIAITDHSQGLAIAHGLTSDDLRERLKEMEQVRDQVDIRILNGMEVDIRKDGSLDMGSDTLENLDLVLGAIHSNFKLSEKEQTERVAEAFSTGLVDIFAHPTGRKIGERKGYDLDMERVIDSAVEHDVVLEINAYPNRLDLDSGNARKAAESGAMISLGTDAHAEKHLDYMRYGVGIARRAWLEPGNILNTKSYDDLIDYLKGRRK